MNYLRKNSFTKAFVFCTFVLLSSVNSMSQNSNCFNRLQFMKMQTASLVDISGFLRSEGWSFGGAAESAATVFGAEIPYSSAKWTRNYQNEAVHFYDSKGTNNFVVLELSQGCYSGLYAEFSSIQEGNAEIVNNALTTTFSEGSISIDFVEASSSNKRRVKLYNRAELMKMKAATPNAARQAAPTQTRPVQSSMNTEESREAERVVTVAEEKDLEEPVSFAQEMPQYPGGELQMQKDIMANAPYPEMEKDNNIQGKVYVQFVVEKDGSVSNVRAQRGIQGGPNLSVVAVEAIKKLNKFTPAKQNGRPVRLVMTTPVNFTLK
jgi:TonB family protein